MSMARADAIAHLPAEWTEAPQGSHVEVEFLNL